MRKDPVILQNSRATKNGNFRSRCGCGSIESCSSENHGKSYVNIDYNYGVGKGKYKIRVSINHYGADYYGNNHEIAWNKFINAPNAYHLFTTHKLDGPGAPGRGGYFQSGNNDTPGRHTGALGLEVFDRNTDKTVWTALWYFKNGFGNWGDQWLRCGHDYAFWFKDN
ncbi:hypothetical protein P4639_27805 [Priestia megaterium]|uniref:hypothetical protein n=1 Tax=Priestia megaterium TaxID=1404 RepID=UPI002E1EAC5A|nr:hypothetical protein [Priestia megaterium]